MITSPWRNHFFGTDTYMKTILGYIPRVYMNNAATPQISKVVVKKVESILHHYTYHNEQNHLSEKIQATYDKVRNIIIDYIGGDRDLDSVVYTDTTTSALNLLSHIALQDDPDQVIITTRMDHMANYLPFRIKFKTLLVRLTPDGNIDMNHYEDLLIKYQGKVKLVAAIAASNITGIVTPYYKMAYLAHKYGAKILLDAVQLVQHKPFSMKAHSDLEHIDFISFDGHKCYTGQSGGVLIGPKEFLDKYHPMTYGAGITHFVNDEKYILKDSPLSHEAGYPDFMGIISFGEALNYLKSIGLKNISDYEDMLYGYMIKELKEIPGIIIYAPQQNTSNLPYASFNMDGISYKKLGSILGFQFGLTVTAGFSGADIYVQDLLGLSNAEAYELFKSGEGYGVVRASLAAFNSMEDIDRLISALKIISATIKKER